MSAQKRSDLQALYGSSGSQLADNTTGDITPAVLRSEGQDITDSHFNLDDDKYTGASGMYLSGVTDTSDLKNIVTDGVTVNFITSYVDADLGIRHYQLVSGTNTENLPYVVRPNDYAASTNEKVWKLLPINGRFERREDIGDWNMDSTASVTLTITNCDVSKIRNIKVWVRADDDAFLPYAFYQAPFFDGSNTLQLVHSAVSTSGSDVLITIRRTAAGTFDSTDFDDTSYNRGEIIIEFVQ